ncbi:endodeoxyribonuclease [Rhizobium sp. XQZ8]|uniref:endodeoxyribonuclease n=1 Tax=Rhizobium populisoli TaxID=2859785 RepID=UPI001CA49806|nr:endodeoxyribonuclease [Rhizobium populisoli]MBW6421634.1 endodeoxyribonuclease [Rhizobium populisoli]
MRNRLEEKVAAQLGPTYTYETHKLSYTISHTYIPDFIDEANKRIVEAKGNFPLEERTKMLAVKKQNPDWQIEMVFQNPKAPINKGSKTTYGDWCDKHGIAWRKA